MECAKLFLTGMELRSPTGLCHMDGFCIPFSLYNVDICTYGGRRFGVMDLFWEG